LDYFGFIITTYLSEQEISLDDVHKIGGIVSDPIIKGNF